MHQKIEKLHDHYIICGFGRVGESAADHFKKTCADYVIVEVVLSARELNPTLPNSPPKTIRPQSLVCAEETGTASSPSRKPCFRLPANSLSKIAYTNQSPHNLRRTSLPKKS